MKNLIVFLSFLFSLSLFSQQKTDYNLSFEKIDAAGSLPLGWNNLWNQKGYTIKYDSLIKTDGKYSVSLELTGEKTDQNFGCIMQMIPVSFNGKQITLKAKMRLEGVDGGAAGMMLRIDSKSNTIQFDNMLQHNISGTIGWQEYQVTLPLDVKQAKFIYAGAILSGKGKLWVDDVQILIDSQNISDVKTEPVITYKAEEDREFDRWSGIDISEANERMTDNLYHLGKLWGFLKYYHPKIAEGEYNWDYELFRIMPKVINAGSSKELNDIFLEWVKSLGPVTELNDKKISDVKDIAIYPELGWIKDKSIFSEELTEILVNISNSKKTTEPYYIELYPNVNNPKFKNENPYPDVKLDEGYRLLALFRYWNMIQYFFPYKNLIEEDWNLVLREFIPKFINKKSVLEYNLNALELIGRIHDTHANIWGRNPVLAEYKGKNIAEANVVFIDGKAVVTDFSPFFDTVKVTPDRTLSAGDVIISVNGKAMNELIQERLPYTPASNYATQLRDIGAAMLRTNDTIITLEIIRDGKSETKTVRCYPRNYYDYNKYYTRNNQKSWSIINEDIGYIFPATIKNGDLPGMMEAFKNTKGIIIDFRCYPSDFFVFTLGKYLMPQPTDFVKFRIGNIEYPGLFTITETLKTGETNNDYYKGKVIIIVNDLTLSSAEYHSMAFRTAPNAKVIGSITAAADGNISEVLLPGGIKSNISGIAVLTPDGKETQRVGIIPDVEVKPTLEGIKNGKDELLEKAIEMIKK